MLVDLFITELVLVFFERSDRGSFVRPSAGCKHVLNEFLDIPKTKTEECLSHTFQHKITVTSF